jgi:Restriction endonuclease
VSNVQKIAPGAYLALGEALAVIYWNLRPFESFVRAALHEQPEILARLNFSATKREVATNLVDILAANERKYQAVTIGLMLEVSAMDSFPNLRQQQDAEYLTSRAAEAVSELRGWTRKHQQLVDDRARHEAQIAKEAGDAAARRNLKAGLAGLHAKFIELHAATNPQQRGRDFETLLNELFALFDLLPRRSFVLTGEQIDGSFSHDTDNYIVEARWWKKAVENSDLSVFAEKVRRKGKNALGLFISVNGFTSGALNAYSSSTPFIAMDGSHLLAVLEQRVALDDLLILMKRHMDDSGNCYMPITRVLDEI